MRASNSFMAWFGPLVIMGIFLWFLFGNTSTHQLLCDGSKSCFRDWIFGLSGWAAAGAAAVTIGSLYKQANAQQKQTDFQLGDADPTIDAVQHTEFKKRAVLRIRNWNRRSMIIREVRLLHREAISVIYVAFDKKGLEREGMLQHKSNWASDFSETMRFTPAIMLEGWVRRDQEPPLLKLRVTAKKQGGVDIEDDWRTTPIVVIYELVGLGEIFTQTVSVHLASSVVDLGGDAGFE